MAARAVAIFVFALLLIRTSGRRSFGQSSPFDACTTVLLGAVLSRAVVGASPIWATIAAAAALALLHRLLALACVRWQGLEDLVSRALLTQRNLAEAVRQKLGARQIDEVALAMLERDGKISVIGKER
ncbi:DUF421 domain-containing protein [Variovorax robiniae]|uniref:DUF421 domain-containing protein n=1 Tax=Variovorax robiniae TaxID=1836199 RepID=A0ABU8XJ92_9BURK